MALREAFQVEELELGVRLQVAHEELVNALTTHRLGSKELQWITRNIYR
jgi:hypothetical protein